MYVKNVMLSVGVICSMAVPVAAQTTVAKAVSVAEVQQQLLLPQTMVTAQVQSRAQADVTAGVEGRLLWLVEPGTEVSFEQEIARLDTSPLQLRVAEMQARLQRAEIHRARLQKDVERLAKLSKQQSIALTQLDQSSADRDSAAAEINILQAQLAQLQDQISRSSVKAPFSGVVTQRFHQQGVDISRTDALIRLVNVADLEVVVFAPLKYAAFVQPEQQLQVFHSGGESQLPVHNVIRVSDVRSQTFEARLRIPAAAGNQFQVGQLVSVAIPTALARLQQLVPRDALVVKSEGQFIFLVDEQQLAQQIAVVPGQGHGRLIAVDAALVAGDKIVVRGGDTLSAGDAIRILSASEFPLKI